MVQIFVLLIPFLLVIFWFWMFNDMLNNDDIPSAEPSGFRWPPEAKNHWIIFFIVLNIFTAGYYYATEYKNRRRF
jgi:uncharacterized RDD family membrane protein YckC